MLLLGICSHYLNSFQATMLDVPSKPGPRMIRMPRVHSGMKTWQSGRVKVLKLCHRRARGRWCVAHDICRSSQVLSGS